MRARLARRGVRSTTAALAVAMAVPVSAAPVKVAAAVTSGRWPARRRVAERQPRSVS